MENISAGNFVLLGLREMENLKYVYSGISLGLYFMIMIISSMIVYITLEEKTLHEPMYIFICNLILNVMVGGSSFLPKLAIDLLSGCSTTSFLGCLTQAFCIQSFASVEVFTFTIMAYDRYLAVSHPLRYHNLMTNRRALMSTLVIWLVAFMSRIVGFVLVVRITLCGKTINNVYCEIMSLLRLACGSTLANDIYGTTYTLLMVIISLSVVIYCYIRTFLICFKISTGANQKAIHTLVTHIMALSTFMAATLFVAFRYRVNGGSLSTTTHVVIPVTGLTVSVTLNPLIYGIRTEVLRIKILHRLQKINNFMHLENSK
ncbi:putative gustatory receptor clone PTE03 [Rana temporaria]|uniref:putative gustatory receptor clone PTE03 n=1 Tax=Rana temporaria TaxID=8407 RepID=UPI001AAD1A78|nr:putative gustatory receptor clone PTE03 [Rana temporaria]XP_040195206.1 putative gustatory receptor clone PTE03 [Rana temporaria]